MTHAHSLAELRRLLPFIRLRAWELCTMLVLGFVTSCLDGLGISLVVLFLYEAIGNVADAAGSEGLIGDIFQRAVAYTGARPVLIGIAVFALVGIASVLRYIYSVFAETIGQRISEEIRVGLHDQYLDVSYDYIRRHDPSFLLDVIEDESWTIAEVIAHLLTIITNVVTIVVFAVLLVTTSWQFTLIAVAGSVALVGCMRALRAPAERLGNTAINVNNALTRRTLMTINCLRTIRAFGDESTQKTRFRAEARTVRDTFVQLQKVSELVTPISEIGHIALLCLFVWVASTLRISFAASLAAVALLHRLRPQVQSLQQRWVELAKANAALRNILSILEKSDKTYLPSGSKPFTGLKREIRFSDVSMRYVGSPSDVLHGLSFSIPAGKTTALVGQSGAGKSTIVNLLLRLYRPDAGEILVDGQPLMAIERNAWLGSLAVAGQDVELTEGTILENIAMSSPNASRQAITAAAAVAGIADFINRQPAGFDAAVGERGLSLSSGQRQRVGLARAVLREPQFLILDEAMSALEVSLEDRIWSNIHEQSSNRTTLFITHRLDAIRRADHVVCIESGRAVEAGSPDELLSRTDGTLRNMIERAKTSGHEQPA